MQGVGIKRSSLPRRQETNSEAISEHPLGHPRNSSPSVVLVWVRSRRLNKQSGVRPLSLCLFFFFLIFNFRLR